MTVLNQSWVLAPPSIVFQLVIFRHFHKMGDEQWSYNNEVATMANVDDLPMSVERLYRDVHKRRLTNLSTYKQDRFKLDGEFYVFDEAR